MAIKDKIDASSPDAILGAIASAGAVAGADRAAINERLANKFNIAPAQTTLNINGFKTQIALDVYTASGNKEAGQIAEELTQLVGDTLYGYIKIAANCAGLNNEGAYLSQELQFVLQSGQFDPSGATEPYDKKVDDDPQSEQNRQIVGLLGEDNLGRLRAVAAQFNPKENEKQKGVNIADALRWGLLNHFEKKIQTRGL
jgi:hypothetical protein